MDNSEAHLDRIEAQRSTDDQHKRRCFPVNVIKNLGTLSSRSFLRRRGDEATPPTTTIDIESVPKFLTTLRLLDLYNHPGEYVAMNSEISSAMRAGNKEFLEKMESYETPMSCFKNNKGDSILHLAAAFGHLELVKSIVSKFPSLLLELNFKDQLPLHVAARDGHLTVVKALVASVTFFSDRLAEEDRERLNPYVLRDKYGNTALHLAIEGRYMEMAASLVNVNQNASFLENNEGISSLYMAVEAGDVTLVKEILKTAGNNDLEGRNSNLDSKLEGRKHLVHVALDARSTGVLDVILNEYPSLEDERDEEGRTCLSFAASIGFYKGICNLLDRSTKNVYVCDEDGSFPIHTAAENGHIRIVKEILKRCPHSKHMLNKLGQNVLHIAAKIGEDNLVKSLMRRDDTKHLGVGQDVDGNTPLHLAVLNWRYRSIGTLASDVKILQLRNDNGLTARGIAESVLKPNYIFHERLTLAFLLDVHASKGCGTVKSLTKPSEPLDHEKSRDYVNTLLLVAALVATMTFAAGFTIPGGFNSSAPHLGRATLTTDPNLFFFLLFDILAMQTSVATICTLIWAQLGDPSLVSSSLNVALPLLLFSLLCMPLAFLCGVVTAIGHVKWFVVIISLISVFFFYWATSILAPHVMLQLSNVSPASCGYLEICMYYQELVSGSRSGRLIPKLRHLMRLKKD